MELARKEGGKPQEPEFWVKSQPISATKAQKKEVEKKERTLPTAWGSLEYKGESFSSPGAFLAGIHKGDVSKIRGKGNYLLQLDAEGFDVYIGDKLISPNLKKEDVEKLKGVGMRIERKKNRPELPVPQGGEPSTKASSFKEYPLPWYQLVESGKLVGFVDMNGAAIPEPTWRQFTSSELDKIAPLKAEE
jgi:hypothetical protein